MPPPRDLSSRCLLSLRNRSFKVVLDELLGFKTVFEEISTVASRHDQVYSCAGECAFIVSLRRVDDLFVGSSRIVKGRPGCPNGICRMTMMRK